MSEHDSVKMIMDIATLTVSLLRFQRRIGMRERGFENEVENRV